jgi:hypothetical protein
MANLKTRIASAWYGITGLRFKGRIRLIEDADIPTWGYVRTPWGTYEFRTSYYGEVSFPHLCGSSCPITPEVTELQFETPEGDLEFGGYHLPSQPPIGYKSLRWVDGVAVATRNNGVEVAMR